jgi:hypothetical protein
LANRRIFTEQLLVLDVTLEYIEPVIYRQILVRSTTPFAVLHEILQAAMGWQNRHLYSFEYKNYRIEEYMGEDFYKSCNLIYVNPEHLPLGVFINSIGEGIKYVYDMGDYWEHKILLKEKRENNKRLKHPRCLAARRACPPEDCGGTGGYEEIIGIFAGDESLDLTPEEREATINWLGSDYHPEKVDIKKINRALQKIYM